MNILPPLDPDGWKRNFNSVLLVGQTSLMLIAIIGWFAWGGAKYNEITTSLASGKAELQRLNLELNGTTARSNSIEGDLRDMKNWRLGLDDVIRQRRGEINSAISAVSTRAETNSETIGKLQSDLSRIGDRQATTDAKLNETLQNMREVQRALTEQNISVEVIRAWVEEQKAESRRVQVERNTK